MQSKEPLSVQLKNQGNDALKNNDIEKAIELYSKAIEEDNTQSIFYSNRARAYKTLSRFNEAYQDALVAIELDDKNIKAHLISGQVLCEIGKKQELKNIEMAITRLTKARTLCAGQKKQEFEKELDTYLFKARKLLWMRQQEIEVQRNEDLIKELAVLNLLIKQQQLVQNDNVLNAQQKEGTHRQIQKYVQIKQQDFTIPEFLKCSSSKQLVMDPLTTEIGYSYESSVLSQCLKQNPNKDPLTGKNINVQNIYPNVNLRQASEDFLSKYGNSVITIEILGPFNTKKVKNIWTYSFEGIPI